MSCIARSNGPEFRSEAWDCQTKADEQLLYKQERAHRIGPRIEFADECNAELQAWNCSQTVSKVLQWRSTRTRMFFFFYWGFDSSPLIDMRTSVEAQFQFKPLSDALLPNRRIGPGRIDLKSNSFFEFLTCISRNWCEHFLFWVYLRLTINLISRREINVARSAETIDESFAFTNMVSWIIFLAERGCFLMVNFGLPTRSHRTAFSPTQEMMQYMPHSKTKTTSPETQFIFLISLSFYIKSWRF